MYLFKKHFYCLRTQTGKDTTQYEDKEENKYKNLSAGEKWIKYVNNIDKSVFPLIENLSVDYLFSIPAHNASGQSIFSMMSSQCTDKHNPLSVETIKNKTEQK